MAKPRTTNHVYTSQNIFLLVGIFAAIFGLLYQLAINLHQNQKINAEIELIRQENQRYEDEIEEKQRKLLYLKTAERIDKEAKMQIGKKQSGENVIVLLNEESPTVENASVEVVRRPLSAEEPSPRSYVKRWLSLLFPAWKSSKLTAP